MSHTIKLIDQSSKAAVSYIVQAQELTSANFAPFGEVIACQGNDFFHINDARTERYHALVATEIYGEAKTGISVFRNTYSTLLPVEIDMLERHPQGSQAFIPMQGQAFLIIVAPAFNAEKPDITQLRAFISNGSQGVNYRAGTWHHPLMTFEAPSDFAVIDRIGSGPNREVYQFPISIKITR